MIIQNVSPLGLFFVSSIMNHPTKINLTKTQELALESLYPRGSLGFIEDAKAMVHRDIDRISKKLYLHRIKAVRLKIIKIEMEYNRLK